MEQILNPLQTTWDIWWMTLLCAFVTGLSKSGLKGLALVTIPVMAAMYSGKASVGLLLPFLIFGDLLALKFYFQAAKSIHLIRLFPYALAGIAMAVLVGNHLNEEQFRLAMGISILVCLVLLLLNEFKRGEFDLTTLRGVAPAFGLAGGFATMIGNAAGPIFNLYLLSKKLPKQTYIATGAWFYLTLNVVKVPLHIWSWKSITAASFQLNLVMLPVLILGAYLGRYIVGFIPEKFYRYFTFTAIGLSALMLFW